MTIQKIREVVDMLRKVLLKEGIPKKRMPEHKFYSSNPKVSQKEMLAHAHWLLGVSLPKLLADKRRLRTRSGHGKIGRHLGAAQSTLMCARMFCRGQLMSQNRNDRSTKKK
jgi:hypothetical protein